VLGHGADAAALLWRNLFSLPALPLTICALFVALVRRRAYAWLRGSAAEAESGPSRPIFTALYVVILGTQALSAAVSLLGLYPWDIASRWSAYLVALSGLALVVVGAEAFALVRGAASRLRDRVGAVRAAPRVGIAVVVVVIGAGWCHSLLYRYAVGGARRPNVATQIAALPVASLQDGSVFVAFYEVPAVRYLYEYGPFRDRAEYPRRFRFESGREWGRHEPFAAGPAGIAFIVSALSIDEARARFPGATLRPMGVAAGNLLAVAGASGGGSGSPP
jgi:hypothetical protein